MWVTKRQGSGDSLNTDSLIDVLHATGPRPELAERLMLFGQFVGAWDVAIANFRADGTAAEVAGEWHFGWALDGRAIVDVWIAPRRSLRDTASHGGYGMTVRFYDETIEAWRATWLAPTTPVVQPFIGRKVGDEIVLEGRFEERTLTRWIFSAITPTRFHWRSVESGDEGVTWVQLQTMDARRASP